MYIYTHTEAERPVLYENHNLLQLNFIHFQFDGTLHYIVIKVILNTIK